MKNYTLPTVERALIFFAIATGLLGIFGISESRHAHELQAQVQTLQQQRTTPS